MEKISIVVPYVDNTDSVWRKLYMEYCNRYKLHKKIAELHTERYEDNIRLIDYQLKLINKNMPWVDKIYLLLMNQEQKPKDLPNNVVVVYHASFIPQKYLPTFNSTTIEMFLWNIKGLGEYFIYANDDMLPLKPLKPSDFFTEDGKIKINWWEEDLRQCYNMFRQQCYNSYSHLCIRLKKKYEQNKYIRPEHSFTPMIKSHCKVAYSTLEDMINKHIRAFRTEYQYNQYIYPIYEKLQYGTCNTDIDFYYTQCNEDELNFDHDIVCLNIIPKDKVNIVKQELDRLL